MPWGKERVQLYIGELPLGNSLETIVVRKGAVREFLPDAKIGNPGPRAYYEVCTHPKLLETARKKLAETPRKAEPENPATDRADIRNFAQMTWPTSEGPAKRKRNR